MQNAEDSNRISIISQRQISREPTVAEYVPFYSQNEEKPDDEDCGVPLVEVLQDIMTVNTNGRKTDTFAEVFKSNPNFPRP